MPPDPFGPPPVARTFGVPDAGVVGASRSDFAGWWQRVASALIDALPVFILNSVARAAGSGLHALLILAELAFSLGNTVVLQGRTGQSLGKRAMRTRLLSERTGAPPGVGRTFLRGLLHVLDALPFELGFLWPLWDRKRQTFADKLVHTVVMRVR